MVRVYSLTQETPSMSKVRKISKKQPLMTMRMLRNNLLPEMTDRAWWLEGCVLHLGR
jgi:hypothetical protein